MHGLLKRHGTNVTILEQEPTTTRSSHNAGTDFGHRSKSSSAAIAPSPVWRDTMPRPSTRLAFRKRANFKEINVVRHLTSWILLYRILRANFDGLASGTVPSLPSPHKDDGHAEYHLEYHDTDSTVTIHFIDAANGKKSSLTADTLTGTDGVNPLVRDLVQLGTTSTSKNKKYSGYGSVSEDAFPRRLINFVWRYNVPPTSHITKEVLTDTSGTRHRNTVLTSLEKIMLVRMVNDVACSASAAFYNGKVLLVGDALVAFRPHFVVATEQAAGHCLGPAKLWKGEKTIQEWNREVTRYGRRFVIPARLSTRALAHLVLSGNWTAPLTLNRSRG
ncbi:6-hydroxynicotinate 3-monooxygenase [Triangularia setosa]|uniref:6-hydroxynicotinate 3-monooxygenase n=1 Tax=Triangularia setosa TaxID=2587417 RepID=A0AAN7A1U7_9PEZI|nr:6-hydroxynicotinate 3-monooxygenase [Podospora setosa]